MQKSKSKQQLDINNAVMEGDTLLVHDGWRCVYLFKKHKGIDLKK